MSASEVQQSMHPQIVVCIGCGCDDRNGCPFGCHWLKLNMRTLRGVCSKCAGYLAQWDSERVLR